MKTLKYSLLVVVLALPIVYLISPWGYLSVRLACAKDGGERVFETVEVDGYLVANREVRISACTECVSVFDRPYEFIDTEVSSDELPKFFPVAGFYRFAFAPTGDADCAFWNYSASTLATILARKGQCVAAKRILAGEVARYAVATRVRAPFSGPLGVDLLVNEEVIFDRTTKQTLAEQRNYLYVPKYQRLLDNQTAQYYCRDMTSLPDFSELVFRVLKVKSRREQP